MITLTLDNFLCLPMVPLQRSSNLYKIIRLDVKYLFHVRKRRNSGKEFYILFGKIVTMKLDRKIELHPQSL